nr:hypothetical protein BaRGS_013691 [Batillaria attramentaria]
MKSYNLTLLGISETRWTQAGQKRLLTGEMLLYSGHEEDNAPHTEGVAFMLSGPAQKALIGWEAHGPRIITASFRTKKKKIKINVIQCYAPTNDSTEEAKDQFYNRLQNVIEKCPQRDVNILMGDFNAKIGSDNTGYEEVMGTYGLGELNENGERFADTCALNSLVIGGSIFQHKKIHKATWERKQKKAEVNNSRTRAAKAKTQKDYTEANKRVKRSARIDKRNCIDSLAEEAEEAAAKGNLKQLYDTTKKLSGKYSKPERPVKDKEGNAITGTEKQLDRWVEHFEELLNRPTPPNPPDVPPADADLPINCGKPSREEIRKAIKQLNNDWKEGYLIKLPKKGDLSNCANYRGITLLSVPGKVFNRILLERMKGAVDPLLRDQQAGFRQNRSCVDQIATLRIIVEQSLEWNSPLYINFVDYEKAFDSVDRETLWKLLRHYGVPTKLVNLIKNSYDGMTCRIIHGGQLTDSFHVKTGVRQGCLLSPFLFLLAIDWIMKTSTAQRRNGIQWTLWTQLEDLDFADDLALLSHNQQQMQDKTTELATTSSQVGLKIHGGKTKILKINTASSDSITLDGNPLEEVEAFTYLGSIIDRQGGTDADGSR